MAANAAGEPCANPHCESVQYHAQLSGRRHGAPLRSMSPVSTEAQKAGPRHKYHRENTPQGTHNQGAEKRGVDLAQSHWAFRRRKCHGSKHHKTRDGSNQPHASVCVTSSTRQGGSREGTGQGARAGVGAQMASHIHHSAQRAVSGWMRSFVLHAHAWMFCVSTCGLTLPRVTQPFSRLPRQVSFCGLSNLPSSSPS